MRESLIAAAFAVAAAAALAPHAARADAAAARRCERLAGLEIGATAIGLPTSGAVIVQASLTGADDASGENCKIFGAIRPLDARAPDIRFLVNIPVAWNGKALHLGGGGYDGAIVDGSARFLPEGVAQPLRQGYATFGSDSGHQGTVADASFATNDEALANFGGGQLKKTHDVAVDLIKRFAGRAPHRMYFEGNSQGGHEGFLVLQRWPKDYDGVVAIHPVYNITALQLDGVHLGQALYGRPGAWLSPSKTKTIYDAVMKACDALDGAQDRVIANVAGCRAAFDVQSLRCPNGADGGDACLSDVQLGAVRAFDSEYRLGFELMDGVDRFARWPLLEGGSTAAFFNLGQSPTASNPPSPSDAFAYVMGDQMVRHMALRDPKVDTLAFDAAQHVPRLQRVSRILDANSVQLEPFRDRGGKLLLLHGTADMAVPPQNTIDYWQRLVAHFGDAPLRAFARFYVVPGFGHGDGPFVATWDWLGALDAWVEQGRSPENLVTTDAAPATAGRTRPLCDYPAWPKYRGAGDVNAATSFACSE
jgi:feruloyl esterase